MDYASCKAGLKTRLSWNVLGEAAETHVTRGSGQQIERPTLRQMRTAAEDLIGAVLCAGLAMTNCWFLLPFAVVKQARPNQTRQSDVRVASGVTGQDTRQGQIRQTSSRRNGFRHHCAALPGSLQGRVASGLATTNPAHIKHRISMWHATVVVYGVKRVDALATILDEYGLSAEGKGLTR